ncbi:MAG: phage antirepressor KilAC domain-containing protein [Peptococcaceae bacterium]|nr:phage antirepressor KilAC domain-containing protein [Peptococcaceae bacterium]
MTYKEPDSNSCESRNESAAPMLPSAKAYRLWTDEAMELVVKELEKERLLRMDAEAQLEKQKNKVRFADAVMESRDSITVGDLASMLKQSGIETGRDRLFQWMREHGYLQSRESEHNLPTQRSLELGILEMQEQAVVGARGTVKVRRSTRITRKGVEYFMGVISREKDAINAREEEKRRAKRQRDYELRKIREAKKQQGA